MTSVRQSEQNRANAQCSSGPSTPEGKVTSSGNSTRIGLYVKPGSGLLPGEDEAAFNELHDQYWSYLEPIGPIEEQCVLTIIDMSWRLRHRLPDLEVGVMLQLMLYAHIHQDRLLNETWYEEYKQKYLASPFSDECPLSVQEVMESHGVCLGNGVVVDAQHGNALRNLHANQKDYLKIITEQYNLLERLQQKRSEAE